ncbi:hypothetical protein J6590_064567 [Homalodisca vitripennis]|nr:hypothetical protein J6590_064567 [Homalodisca vitripennis]
MLKEYFQNQLAKDMLNKKKKSVNREVLADVVSVQYLFTPATSSGQGSWIGLPPATRSSRVTCGLYLTFCGRPQT